MIKIHEIDYEDLGGVASGKDSFRVVRHLELIFPLMSLQALSFSSGVLTGNLLNTSIFREFNLLLSRFFFVTTICVAFCEFFLSEKMPQQIQGTQVSMSFWLG